MVDKGIDQLSFSAWIKQPEMLVALSALLLSLCGLFIAIYEASLIRQAQRASVWPHVEVSASVTAQALTLRVENTGVGPARIRAAAVTHGGEIVTNWSEMLARIAGPKPGGYDFYLSLINGRVLPANASEAIFSLSEEYGPGAKEEVVQLRQAVFVDQALDVTVCYCSVYDECWTATLQDVIQRSRGGSVPETRAVESCDAVERSGI